MNKAFSFEVPRPDRAHLAAFGGSEAIGHGDLSQRDASTPMFNFRIGQGQGAVNRFCLHGPYVHKGKIEGVWRHDKIPV